MAVDVAVYHIAGHKRSSLIGTAMAEGIAKIGDRVRLIESGRFRGPEAKIAVFYGYETTLKPVFRAYRDAGLTVVFVDLGYFGRNHGGKFSGYHKVSVNDRHPTKYFQARRHKDDRFAKFNLQFKPWREQGKHILLCGTSDKGARADGFQPEQWERWAARSLQQITKREIIYRPKPSWITARPIPGTTFAKSKEDVAKWLVNCHAVVSHHSNVCVDAFLAGVPNFCIAGAGLPLSHSDLQHIETPLMPKGRERWASDLCYTQYNIAEMRDGTCWRMLKDEGLIA